MYPKVKATIVNIISNRPAISSCLNIITKMYKADAQIQNNMNMGTDIFLSLSKASFEALQSCIMSFGRDVCSSLSKAYFEILQWYMK